MLKIFFEGIKCLKYKRYFFYKYYIYSMTFILCNMNTNSYHHIKDLLNIWIGKIILGGSNNNINNIKVVWKIKNVNHLV